MAKTLPSQRVLIADAPEIKKFKAEFVYNFFIPDERGNDSGYVPHEFIDKKSSESFDSQFIDSNKFNRFAPRYVKFEWKPYNITENIIPNTIKIKDNLNKIQYEQDFLSSKFTSIIFQDTDKDKKMNFFIKRLLQKQRNYDDPQGNETLQEESHVDMIKTMVDKTSDFIEPSLICESMVDLGEEGYIFKDRENSKIEQQSLLKEMTKVKTFGHLNSKFLWKIMQTGLENNLNIFEDEIKESKNRYISIEDEALKAYEPDVIRREDYDIEIQDYVGQPKKINAPGYIPKKQIAGYIIDKTEVDFEGNIKEHQPIIIENPNINTTIDLKIKYGSTYYYSIRTIAYIETQVEEIETNEFYIVSYLFSSKNSSSIVVKCVEDVPPPPPADVDVRWDANTKELVLKWAFPINKQRDIKKWQIFRRKNIYESFELLALYDFNDSIIKVEDNIYEVPDSDLIYEMSSPLNSFVDYEFKKNKTTGEYPTFIYSVCSVDAHGYSSNYSIQIQCTFDRFKNKLIKKIISNSNAPKAFPNFYLLTDTFVDVMATSNKTKSMKIYFTPEYLKVFNSSNQDLKLLKTDKDDSNCLYKINLINLDLQEQENVEIYLKDLIRTEEKQPVLLTPEKPRFGQKRINKSRTKI